MTVLLALAGLGLLLLAGLALRVGVPLLRRLMLPASLLGGFVGLAAGPHGLGLVPPVIFDTWASLPAILINIVFASLFLGIAVPSAGAIISQGGPLVRFSVVTAMGQYLVGLLLTWWVLTPLFGVPYVFGCLIEVGFSGGHGTAAAMAGVFSELGFAGGGALGQMSATVGLVAGVVGGVALIQHGVRRGQLAYVESGTPAWDAAGADFVAPQARRPIAFGTVNVSVVEPLTLHVAVTLLAVALGWLMLQGVQALGPALRGFPLFPLAMVGGMLIQFFADRTGLASSFDRGTFQRIMGLALDVLIVAAIASLRLDLFLSNVVPFTLLMLAAVAWVVGSFLVMAPRMLRDAWFEQAIVVYGTQTGVAAVGLMLLRIVDPDHRTPAAQAFAARSMVTSPLLGGGLVTATMPLLVQQFGPARVLGGVVAVMLACYFWPGRRGVRP